MKWDTWKGAQDLRGGETEEVGTTPLYSLDATIKTQVEFGFQLQTYLHLDPHLPSNSKSSSSITWTTDIPFDKSFVKHEDKYPQKMLLFSIICKYNLKQKLVLKGQLLDEFTRYFLALSSLPNQITANFLTYKSSGAITIFSSERDKLWSLLEKGPGLAFSAIMERHNS